MTRAVVFAIVLAAAGAPMAQAQVFGQFGDARTLALNGRVAGAFFQASESSIGVVGQLRMSFHPGVDFAFQGGISRLDVGDVTRSAIRLGTDVRLRIVEASLDLPVDIAVGGTLGVETADEFNLLSVGPTGVISHTLDLGGISTSPYLGVAVLFSRLDLGNFDQTDVSLGLRLGADFEFQPSLHALIELQPRFSDEFNDGFSFAAGVQTSF